MKNVTLTSDWLLGRKFGTESPVRISVALATYNGAAFLLEQLLSIAKQTCLPDELIVSDDSSDDATSMILDDFATIAPFRVRVVRNANRVGYAGNFERALRHCSGEYVFFSDQDDVWLETKVERVVAEFERHPAVHLVIHDLLAKPHDLVGEGRSALKAVRGRGDSDLGYVAGCATAIRRPLVALAQPFPQLPGIGHDTWLHMLAHHLNARAVMEEALIFYRRHGGNVSVSSVDPSSAIGLMRCRLERHMSSLTAARSGLRFERLAINHALLESLAARLRHASAHGVDPAVAQFGAVAVASEARRLTARIEMLGLPIWKRPWYVARLLAGGMYRGASGFRAMCLDLITNKATVDAARLT